MRITHQRRFKFRMALVSHPNEMDEPDVVALANEVFDSCERSSADRLSRIELTLGVRHSSGALQSKLAAALGLDVMSSGQDPRDQARAFEGAFGNMVRTPWWFVY